MEHEIVTQQVLFLLEPMLQNAKQLQYARLSLHARSQSFLDSIYIFLRSIGLPAPFRCRIL
jgi:hypothetical protein